MEFACNSPVCDHWKLDYCTFHETQLMEGCVCKNHSEASRLSVHTTIYMRFDRNGKQWHWLEAKLKKLGLEENSLLSSFTTVVITRHTWDLEEVRELVRNLIRIEVPSFEVRLLARGQDGIDFHVSNGKIKRIIKNGWVSEEAVEYWKARIF